MALGGKDGFVNGKNCVREWNISEEADLKDYRCSATDGATGRVDGNKNWNGTYSAYGAIPEVLPGASFTFEGIIAGPAGSGTDGASGTAMCDQVEIVWDMENGEIVSHTVSFSANGALSRGTVDSTGHSEDVPNPLTSVGLTVEFFDLESPAVKDSSLDLEYRTITLTLTANNQPFVGSSVPGETQRVAGHYDASLACTVYTEDFGELPALNLVREARVYTASDKSTYWNLKWVKFGANSGMQVDVEGNSLVGAQMNAEFNGFAVVDPGGSATPTKGRIAHEDSGGDTVVWNV